MKNKLKFLALLAMISFFFTSCNSNKKENSNNTSSIISSETSSTKTSESNTKTFESKTSTDNTKYLIELDLNGGVYQGSDKLILSGENRAIEYYKTDKKITLSRCEKSGYQFMGWVDTSAINYNENNPVLNQEIDLSLCKDYQFKAVFKKIVNIRFNNFPEEVDTVFLEGETYDFPTCKKTGEYISYWLDNALNKYEADSTFVAKDNLQFDCYWETYVYNLSFDTYGLYDVSSMKIEYGSIYILPTPICNNYSFEGWYYNGQLLENQGKWEYDFENKDISLRASWEIVGLQYEFNEADKTCCVKKYTGNLTEITLPEYYKGYKLTKIDDNAFSSSSLKNITLPDTVEEIGQRAFSTSVSLESFTMPENLTKIGNSAFEDCKSLTKVTSNINLEYIGEKAFYGCSKVENFYIPYKTTFIGNGAFYNCSLATFDFASPNCFVLESNGTSTPCNITSINLTSPVDTLGKDLCKIGYSICYNLIYTQGFELSGLPSYYLIDEQTQIDAPSTTGYNFDGYEFYYYYYDNGNEFELTPINNSLSVVISKGTYGDLVLAPKYSPKQYTVSLNPNGGQLSTTSITTTFDSSYTLPTPTKTGYNFLGWYLDDKKVSTIWTYDVENPILVAKWEAKKYTITFNTNLDDVTLDSLEVEYDKNFTLPNVENSEYILSYWEYNESTFKDGIWNIDSNITLNAIIESKGLQYELNSDNISYSVKGISGTTENIIVPLKHNNLYVTKISVNAFNANLYIKTVTLNGIINEISKNAFFNCTQLQTISGLESCITIGQDAFSNCTNLKNIVLPEGLNRIEKAAFFKCTSLSNITLPNTLVFIGANAFYSADITNINFVNPNYWFNQKDESVDFSSIDNIKTALYTVNYEYTKKYYSIVIDLDYQNTKLKYYYDYKNEYTLAEFTRDGYTFLHYINTETNEVIDKLPAYTYKNYSIKAIWEANEYTININYNCEEIENTSIKVKYDELVTLPSVLRQYYEVDCYVYDNNTSLIYTPGVYDKTTDITIVAIWKGISVNVKYLLFSSSTIYTETVIEYEYGQPYEVYVPNTTYKLTVWRKGNDKFKDGDFFGYTEDFIVTSYLCSDGLEFKIDNENKTFAITGYNGSDTYVIIPTYIDDYEMVSIENNAFENKKTITNIVIPITIKSIGNYAFKNCLLLNNIENVERLEYVGEGAFYGCESITYQTLPDSLDTVPSYLYYGCEKLKSVTGNNIKTIGEYSFYGCTELTEISTNTSIETVLNHGFYNCENLTFNIWTLNTIEEFAFTGSGLTDVIFETSTSKSSIKIIENFTFENCKKLTNIVLGSNVKYICKGAFSHCESLESVTIPENVLELDREVFYDCTKLKNVSISSKIEYIGGDCFEKCTNLAYNTYGGNNYLGNSTENYLYLFSTNLENTVSTIIFNNQLRIIAENTFNHFDNIINLNLSDTNLISVGQFAFYDCEGLKTINLGSKLKYVDDYAFGNCALETINLSPTILTIGYRAFINDNVQIKQFNINYSSSGKQFYIASTWNSMGARAQIYNISKLYSDPDYTNKFEVLSGTYLEMIYKYSYLISVDYVSPRI
ncbi:MAG: leucine-rich repeat protein [Acholeplasmatales bacterium]|nr:leucine-rich repeat protein [Acholeplasmatales bacterium]